MMLCTQPAGIKAPESRPDYRLRSFAEGNRGQESQRVGRSLLPVSCGPARTWRPTTSSNPHPSASTGHTHTGKWTQGHPQVEWCHRQVGTIMNTMETGLGWAHALLTAAWLTSGMTPS